VRAVAESTDSLAEVPGRRGSGFLRWLRLNPEQALLVALPLLLLALNSRWIWSGPHRDAWLYYGYFQNGVDYLRRFPELYYGSRLSVILPGWLAHHLLPAAVANLALHLGLYWLALLSFNSLARELFGRRAALLAAITLGCQTYFLIPMGWNYVDGFGIAYFLLALAAVTHAARSPGRPWLLTLAGAAACAMAAANLFYVVYSVPLALAFMMLNPGGARRALLPALGWFLLGGVGAFFLFCLLSAAAGGPWFFLEASVNYAREALPKANPFRDPSYRWLRGAHHLVFPAAITAGSCFLLLRAGWRRTLKPISRESLLAHLSLLLVVGGITWGQVFGGTSMLQHFYYSSFMTPLAALALAALLAPSVSPLGRRAFGACVVVTLCAMAIPLAFQLDLARLRSWSVPRTVWPLAAGIAAVYLLLGRAGPGWKRPLALVGFGLQSLLVIAIQGHFRADDPAVGGPLFLQMDRAGALIDQVDPTRRLRLWYDEKEVPHGRVFDAIACAFLLGPRMVNLSFPQLPQAVLQDGLPLEPPQRIVVLSSRQDVLSAATASMEKLGFGVQLIEQVPVPGPVPNFLLTFLEVLPRVGTTASAPAPPTSPGSSP
jgi:hypothetical protein